MFLGNRGTSFFELLAALIILMIGAMGVATVSELTSEKIKFDDARTNETSLAKLLRAQLEFSDQCATRVQFAASPARLRAVNRNQRRRTDVTPIRIQVPGILNGQNGDWVSAGTVIASGLTVQELAFYNPQFVPNSYNPPTDPTAEYLVNIRLTYDFPGKALLGGAAGKSVELGAIVIGVQGSNPNNPNVNNNLTLVACHGVGTTSSTEDICTSLNCEFVSGQCSCATPSFDCPPGTLLTGFQAGTAQCTEIGGTCPSGRYLVGVGLGRADCRDVPIYDPGFIPATASPTPAASPTPTSGACVPDNSLATNQYVCPSNGYNGNTVGVSEAECCSGYGEAMCPSCPGNNCSAIDVPIFCKPAPGGGSPCQRVGTACTAQDEIDYDGSTVDWCGCVPQSDRINRFNAEAWLPGNFILEPGDHSTSGVYNYTLQCQGGILRAVEMSCWLFSGSCVCR